MFYQAIITLQVDFPLTIHGLHVINYSWILNTVFYLFKQFIPKPVWRMIHFHGCDMSSLHKHIDPKYLPPDYGGCCKYVVSMEEWLRKMNRFKDDFLVRELRELGFSVEDEEDYDKEEKYKTNIHFSLS